MPLYIPPIKTAVDPGSVTRADAALAGTLYDQANQNANVNLSNDNKAKINAILVALRNAGVIK